MNKTKIEWVVNPDGTQGYTWNPVIGCKHGCEYCYARRMNDRYKWIESWNDPDVFPLSGEKLRSFRKPKTIFVGSITDLFGAWVSDSIITDVLHWTKHYDQHTFLFLTKNPKRYREFKFPDNCWLGITVTNNESFWKNETMLKPHGFISFEPLLEDIKQELLSYMLSMDDINWIIIGSLNQNGKPVRIGKGGTRLEWVTNLIAVARNYNVPVFIKDSLSGMYWPGLPTLRELPYLK